MVRTVPDVARGTRQVLLLVVLILGTGCTSLRSQLRDPRPAEPDQVRRAIAVMSERPLPDRRRAEIIVEWDGGAMGARGSFSVDAPDSFAAELIGAFGEAMLTVRRDATAGEVIAADRLVQRKLRHLHEILALWLLGACTDGPVWDGVNGLAIDCAATGPDEGAVWRIWVDSAQGIRVRGELLRDESLTADFICDVEGRCVLQDLERGIALRVSPVEGRD